MVDLFLLRSYLSAPLQYRFIEFLGHWVNQAKKKWFNPHEGEQFSDNDVSHKFCKIRPRGVWVKKEILLPLCVSKLLGAELMYLRVYTNNEAQWEDTFMCVVASLVMSK